MCAVGKVIREAKGIKPDEEELAKVTGPSAGAHHRSREKASLAWCWCRRSQRRRQLERRRADTRGSRVGWSGTGSVRGVQSGSWALVVFSLCLEQGVRAQAAGRPGALARKARAPCGPPRLGRRIWQRGAAPRRPSPGLACADSASRAQRAIRRSGAWRCILASAVAVCGQRRLACSERLDSRHSGLIVAASVLNRQ